MKLTIELVPQNAWNKSLAQTLPRNIWNTIRQNYIEQNGKKCEICGQTEGTFNLHEVWSYDDKNHIQKLERLILLCTACHQIKHIGLTKILASQGKLNLDAIISHFCKVNNCSIDDFQKHEKEAFLIWHNRSIHLWKQDFETYSQYFRKYYFIRSSHHIPSAPAKLQKGRKSILFILFYSVIILSAISNLEIYLFTGRKPSNQTVP